MPYTERFLEAARYNPILAAQYYWTVSTRNINALARNEKERTKRAIGYSIVGFEDEFYDSLHEKRMDEAAASVGHFVLDNIEILVRTSIERPPMCQTCKKELRRLLASLLLADSKAEQ